MDTIYALATARGKAGVAIFRLSGPSSHEATRLLSGELPPHRQAQVRTLRHEGEVLDNALVLTFAEGASFTGEAMAELQIHGGLAVVQSVARALSSIPGLRQATAGEFTRRALENGRLDLAQVEGLADLIDAETEAQQRQALRILSGAVGKRAEIWRRSLIRAAALIEATIDFADEDVPVDVTPEVKVLVQRVLADLNQEMVGALAAERLREGFEVAIVGPPNIGKSTLLNTLAGREAAITSERAGTTRDVIEVRMNLAGLPVTLLDTAGMRESDDEVELIGMDRGKRRAEAADIRIFLVDDVAGWTFLAPQKDDIVVLGKADLRSQASPSVSGLTGAGVDSLIAQVVAVLERRVSASSIMVRERHRRAITGAIAALEAGLVEVGHANFRHELVAAELRSALNGLDLLVGRVGVEDLLDEIFASFCIGK